MSGGTLNVDNNDTVGAVTLSSGTISGDSILTGSSYSLTDTGTISAILAGSGALTKTGSGEAILSGANTYTGTTTISAGTLVLGNSTNTLADTAAVTVSGGTLNVDNNDTVGAVTLSSGTISGDSILTGSSYSLTNTGTISATLAGSGALTKTGSGEAILSGANTYTGTTTISAGTLQIGNNGTSGVLGTGNVTNNAALVFNRSNAYSVSNIISGSGSVTQSGGGTVTLAGINTYTGATNVNTGTTLAITGSIEDSASINVAGTGTLNVSGMSSGTLTLQSGQTLTGDGTVVGNLVIGDGSVLSPGNSPGTISTGNVTYGAGGTYLWEINSVTAGLEGQDPGWDLQDISGNLTVGSTNATGNTFTIAITSLSGDDPGDVANFNRYSDYNWTIATVSGSFTGFAADKFTLDITDFTNDGVSASSFSINTVGSDLVIHYAKVDDNRVYWKGDVATGNWNVNTNWVNDEGPSVDPTSYSDVHFITSTVVSQATTTGVPYTINSLTMDAGATQDVSISGNALTINADGLTNAIVLNSGVGKLLINSDVILGANQTWLNDSTNATGTVTDDFEVAGSVNNAGHTLTVSGTGDTEVSGNILGSGGLTKSGTGTLTLSGTNNTYTGTTTINAGTLVLAHAESIHAEGAVVLANVAGAELDISANTTIGSLAGGGTTGGDVVLGNYTLTVGDATNTSYGGKISGDGGLTKQGAGTLTLSGNSVYTGTTSVTAGTLRATTSASALGAGNLALSGGTLELANDTGLSFSRNTSISANTIIESDRLTAGEGVTHTLGTLSMGAWTLTLSKDATVTSETAGLTFGAVTLSATGGTFTADAGTLLTLGTVSGDTFGFTVGGAGNTTIGAIGTGIGTLTKTGTGTLTLSGVNTYSGATTISEGTVVLSESLANSAIGFSGAGTVSLASGKSITQAITTTADNQGTLTLAGTNTITGAVGTDATHDLATINSNGTSVTNTFVGNVFSNTLAFGGDSTARFNAEATLGSVSTSTNGTGTLFLEGDSTVTGAIGTSALRLKEVEIALAIAESGAFNDIYAVTTTINSAGTVQLNGNVTGISFVFEDNGSVNLADGKSISATITTDANNQGVLNFAGTHTVGGTIGTSSNSLNDINLDGGTVTTSYGLYAATIDIANDATLRFAADAAMKGALATAASGSAAATNARVDLQNYTVTHTGDMTLGDYSNLDLDIAGASDYGQATVTGTVTLPATVAITINSVEGTFASGTEFLVINGTTGSGVAGGNTVTDSSYVWGFTATDRNHQDLILTAVREHPFNTISSDANVNAVGAALEGARTTTTNTDMLNVLNTLDNMTSAQQISSSLATMMPDMSSGALMVTRSMNSQFLKTISNRLAYARNGRVMTGIASGDMFQGTGFWMQGVGSHQTQGTRDGIEGFDANTFGSTIGFDKILDEHLRLGLAGGYGFGSVDAKTPGNPNTDINSWQATLYGSYDSADLWKARRDRKFSNTAARSQGDRLWYVDGMLSFAQNNYDTSRGITIGSEGRTAKADYNGQQYSTKFETGYNFMFEKTRALEVTPFTSLGYNYLYMNKYNEHGADSLDLQVNGEGHNQLEQGVGLKLAYPFLFEKAGTLTPSIRGAWLYDYIGDRYGSTSTFAGGGPSFRTQGADPAQSAFLIGSELAFMNHGNMTLLGNFDWEIRDAYSACTYYLTVRFDF